MRPDVIAKYELEPIGENGALEANGQVHWYCSMEHAVNDTRVPEPSSIGRSDDYEDGTVCDLCGGKIA